MPSAKAVSINDALSAMKDTDDSIAEIGAMIPRLLKMKSQLIAQKEYIEVAVKDSIIATNTSKEPSTNAGNPANRGFKKAYISRDPSSSIIVDYRVKLFKHRALVTRLKDFRNPTDVDAQYYNSRQRGVLDDVLSDEVIGGADPVPGGTRDGDFGGG